MIFFFHCSEGKDKQFCLVYFTGMFWCELEVSFSSFVTVQCDYNVLHILTCGRVLSAKGKCDKKKCWDLLTEGVEVF